MYKSCDNEVPVLVLFGERKMYSTCDNPVPVFATCSGKKKMTPVGFEPTPLRTGTLLQRLRPLGHRVLGLYCSKVILGEVLGVVLQAPLMVLFQGC